MLITGVDALHLRVPRPEVGTNDPTQEVLLLRVTTDEGLVGLAECNHTAGPALAFLSGQGASSMSAGVRDLLVGRDLAERERIGAELYAGNYLSARRGIGLAVLHALDVCLWDLEAQSRGEPLWRVLWGDDARAPEAYLTLYTGPGDYDDSVARMHAMLDAAAPLGYGTVKLEPLPECVPEERIAEFVAAGRARIGPSRQLFVDVGHRFRDAEHACAVLDTLLPSRPALLETPLPVDDVWEYGRLCRRSPVPIAASELYESRWDFKALLELGDLHVAQPWPNRMGISDTLSVIDDARRLGRRVIVAGWNTTPIGLAAGVHVAAGLGPGVALEHNPSAVYDVPLRAVAGPDLRLADGRFELPRAPGLGVALDHERLDRHAVPLA